MHQSAYLILENGKIFSGKAFGAIGDVAAEIVFTTGVTGYLEALTDKSNFGLIVVQTFPLIGNYGVILADAESDSVYASAYIVKNWCEQPSNFRSSGNIDAFLEERGIVGLYDIDTRTLTKMIRENGVMNGRITTNPYLDMNRVKKAKTGDATESVTTSKTYVVKAEFNSPSNNVVLLDFGLKNSLIDELVSRNYNVTVMPCNSSLKEILPHSPCGIILSGGPGNPADNTLIIENVKEIITSNIPIFGICIGHQLLALANGFETVKMKCGHRGTNLPVKDLETGRIYITSQNHGYTVVPESIDNTIADISFSNINDKTVEGIEYKNITAFSVQFQPTSCGGPQHTGFLFDRFDRNINRMEVR